MVKKIVVVFIALAFVLSAIAAAFAGDVTKKETNQTSQLVALLPESDGIMTMDVKRLLDEALPQILSGNQARLDEILGKIDEIKTKTGFDIRRFEQVAIGVKGKRVSAKEMDFEPVLLARGTYDTNGLVALAKIASKGKYRTEKVGNQTVYLFSIKEIAEDNKPKNGGNSIFSKIIDGAMKGLSREVALAGYDSNTLAIGTFARVKETLEAKKRVNSELLDLVYRKQNAVMSFGVNMPKGTSGFIGLDNEEIDMHIDMIRQMYGSLNVNGSSAILSVTAKTTNVEGAKTFESFLSGIKQVGALLLGGTKGDDKKVYMRMIENSKISQAGNEVLFDLEVPQSDIDIIVK